MDAVGESLGLLRKEVGDEKDHANESRAIIHRRLDEQAKQIGHLESTLPSAGKSMRRSATALHLNGNRLRATTRR
jgi:hypothetical protein